MDKPLVSICIPTFNGEDFIEEALLSAINQTYSHVEIIVSDDDSSDNTLEIVKEFESITKIPFYVYNHNPSGIGTNWNNCIIKANGGYMKFLFQDDTLEPDCIEKMMKVARENENIGLVFCRRKIIYNQQNDNHVAWVMEYGNVHEHWTSIKEVQKGSELLKDRHLLNEPQNKVGEPTVVLLKKDVFKKVGYFNTELKQTLDFEFWYRAFTKFDVGFVNAELASFRLHDKQTTALNASQTIIDYKLYPKLLYKNCFFYLNNKVKKNLFFRYNLIGKIILKIKILGKKILYDS